MIIDKKEFIERKVKLLRYSLNLIFQDLPDRDFSTVYESEYRNSELVKGLWQENQLSEE